MGHDARRAEREDRPNPPGLQSEGAVSVLFDSDTALGMEAYEFILELSS